MLPLLNDSNPIVEQNRTRSQIFRTWTEEVGRLSVLTGSGSPEGTVSAQATRLYMDTAGTAGAILYIKRDDDIAGDATKGWILI